ncbi:hypothetical protein [Microcoleus sp. bin38.metabat.b11b12b14.051]|uniref:hypothetical protein n=1 Tax=Microcoleus sp. bin38.metabat.b11b12b14.051 TaxID=2742709 RepID=UPI0025EA34EB|nr:hypothetical protein [Microcoleus sp. bin38.metabat.b11b12b14.051]
MKLAQLVPVWINVFYSYFTWFPRDRTNCNALNLFLRKNTEDWLFLICGAGGTIRPKACLSGIWWQGRERF